MSEIDFVLNVELMWKNNTKGLFYFTWCREYVCKKDENGVEIDFLPKYAENYTAKEELKEMYYSDKSITLANFNVNK